MPVKTVQVSVDGVRIRTLRMSLGIPQHHLAHACGVGPKYIHKREGVEVATVSEGVLDGLVTALGVGVGVIQGVEPLPMWAHGVMPKKRGVRVQTVMEPEKERAEAVDGRKVSGAWVAIYGRLGTELVAAGWEHKRLARALGTSSSNVGSWYTERAKVPERRIWQIATITGKPEFLVREWCNAGFVRVEKALFDYPATGWGHLLARTGLRACALASQLGVKPGEVRAWASMDSKPSDPLVIRKLDLLLRRAA